LTEWPSWIAEAVYPISETEHLPAHNNDMEAFYIRQRKKATSSRMSWELQWNDKVSLTEAEYQDIKLFFEAHRQSSFSWTHPATSVVYTVYFNQQDLNSNILYPYVNSEIHGYRTLRVRFIQATTNTIDYATYASVTSFPVSPEPKYPISEKSIYQTYQSEVLPSDVRKKWSGSKKVWILEWDDKCSLLETEYQYIRGFFLAKQGSSFTWTHPATNVSYTVMFMQDKLETEILHPGYRTLKLQIREV